MVPCGQWKVIQGRVTSLHLCYATVWIVIWEDWMDHTVRSGRIIPVWWIWNSASMRKYVHRVCFQLKHMVKTYGDKDLLKCQRKVKRKPPEKCDTVVKVSDVWRENTRPYLLTISSFSRMALTKNSALFLILTGRGFISRILMLISREENEWHQIHVLIKVLIEKIAISLERIYGFYIIITTKGLH